MRMPFGKYRGFQVDELPENYLEWLVENVDLREPLRSAVHEALGIDDDCGDSFDFLPQPQTIKSVYRKLAVKWHPDHGGSTDAMQAINEFYEELKKI